jgi:hypothetical protein
MGGGGTGGGFAPPLPPPFARRDQPGTFFSMGTLMSDPYSVHEPS